MAQTTARMTGPTEYKDPYGIRNQKMWTRAVLSSAPLQPRYSRRPPQLKPQGDGRVICFSPSL